MRHILKIQKQYYEAVASGRKTFEIRYNDRDYKQGDTIILQCLNHDNTSIDTAMPKLTATIGYITTYNQVYDWVVFSLLNVDEVKDGN